MKYLILSALLWGCLFAQPVLHLEFEGDPAPATVAAPPSYAEGVKGQCLDLSSAAYNRLPLSCSSELPKGAFSITVWVRTETDHQGAYTILSNEFEGKEGQKGWAISMQENGAWQWTLSDGKHSWDYSPTPQRQAINDGRWHLITFSLDPERKEARFFLDTDPMAIYHLGGLEDWEAGEKIHIGGNPDSDEPEWYSFQGYLDEVRVWDECLDANAVVNLWEDYYGEGTFLGTIPPPKQLKVLAWNIWHGGHEHGREAGVQRVIEVIKASKADIICMQETYGSGPEIADALGYHFYLRSSNLSIMSHYPILETIDIYEPFRCGGAYIDLNGEKIAVFSLWIHYLPSINRLKNPEADLDSLMIDEEATRGTEIKDIIRDLKPHIAQADSLPIIIAGDYNSGSHLDWTEATRERHYGHLFPWPVSQRMAEAGFVDAFRKTHPDPLIAPGRTWSPIFSESIQERIDYVYYQGVKLQAVKAQVIDQHPLRFPSDHAAVLAEFELTY